MSYKQRIADFLVKNGYLTFFDALNQIGTTRASEYIRQLRREQWQIETEWRSAGKKRYGVYRLISQPQSQQIQKHA
jgi:hypothetical protein